MAPQEMVFGHHGNDLLEATLAMVVTRLHRELDEPSAGIYLEGSFAWGNPVATSDVDLRVVTSKPLSEGQRACIERIKAEAMIRLGREVGVALDTTDQLLRIGAVRFQRSRHLGGEDLRSQVPLKPLSVFAKDTLSTARELVLSLRRHYGAVETFPVGPPNAASEFRGYEVQHVLDGGSWIPSSKRLVTNVLAVATARVALRGATYVHSKAEVPEVYARTIGDTWGAYVKAVYELCRMKSAYRLPKSQHERAALTTLCVKAVEFENTLMDC